jgi:hypothetical protein
MGNTGSRLWRVWYAMIARCTKPNVKEYKHYGGRGISVCDRWLDFQNFEADMGERPSDEYTLDRINNDGNYEPSNCRWATWRQQAHNRRGTKLVIFENELISVHQLNIKNRLKRMIDKEAEIKDRQNSSIKKITNKGFDMTEKQALALINRKVTQAGGKKAASYVIGIDHSHLCSVLKGTRGIPRYLAVWAGLVERKQIIRTYEVVL